MDVTYMDLPTINDFKNIVINNIPLIDVRAPIEYEKGAFSNSINLPLMNNEERHLVGIRYKEEGNEEAVKLGHQLVNGAIKKERVDKWITQINKNPDTVLYCFRGGQRSKISQEWIYEATGIIIPRLEGGYKAFRNFLIQSLEPAEQKCIPILLGGYTGSGKTILLKKLHNFIDLEGLANHRGSSFGKQFTPQPTQINFENNLAYALINLSHKGYRYMVLEDEGNHIGKCFIPKPMAGYFNSGGLVILETPFDERVQITLDEYVIQAQTQYIKELGNDQGLVEWHKYIDSSLYRIKNRLGGLRYGQIKEALDTAFSQQLQTVSYKLHENWIGYLLKEYYDPMYQYQIENTDKKILFKGNAEDVLTYFKEYYSEKN